MTEYTVREFAKAANLHILTVYHYVKSGRLQARKHNGHWWKIPESELDRYNRGEVDVNGIWSKKRV
jgi:excisionase family DNA binding protein